VQQHAILHALLEHGAIPAKTDYTGRDALTAQIQAKGRFAEIL